METVRGITKPETIRDVVTAALSKLEPDEVISLVITRNVFTLQVVPTSPEEDTAKNVDTSIS